MKNWHRWSPFVTAATVAVTSFPLYCISRCDGRCTNEGCETLLGFRWPSLLQPYITPLGLLMALAVVLSLIFALRGFRTKRSP